MDVEDLKKELNSLLEKASETMEDTRNQFSSSVLDATEQISFSMQNAKDQLSSSMESAKEQISFSMENAREQLSHSVEDVRVVMEQKKEEMQQILLEGQHQIQEKIVQLEQMANDIDWFVAVPLIISFAALWSIFMFRTRNTDESYASSFHAVLVVILAFGNMFYGLDEKFMFVFMTGYFISDLIHYCFLPKYFIYIFHHVLTVFAVHYMVTADHYAIHLFASKAVMVEISTPFLNFYRSTNKAIYGVLFGLSFLAVRIIWLSYITFQGYFVSKYPIEIIIMVLFCGLNLYWFLEIVQQARGMVSSKPSKEEAAPEDSIAKAVADATEKKEASSAPVSEECKINNSSLLKNWKCFFSKKKFHADSS